MPPKAPFLKYDRLRGIADDFLSTHHQSRSIPIPIEEIVEFQFKIDIVPMPGLHGAFDVDSFINSDFTEIRIDGFVYESRPRRYRFSLAHELSHRLLHSEVFNEFSFGTIAEWKQAISSIPEKDYRILEWQANSLAGLILVPPCELAQRFKQVAAAVEKIGLSLDDLIAIEAIEGKLAEAFVVSPAVVHRRLEFDGLIKQ